jgi:hypothetical protein
MISNGGLLSADDDDDEANGAHPTWRVVVFGKKAVPKVGNNKAHSKAADFIVRHTIVNVSFCFLIL